MQLIAREERGGASGFATLFWSFDTLHAGEIGVMNDLYVIPEQRGEGLGALLIAACVERCRVRGAVLLGVADGARERARPARLRPPRSRREEMCLVPSSGCSAARCACSPGTSSTAARCRRRQAASCCAFAEPLASWSWDVALLQEVPPWWPAQLARAAHGEERSVLTSRNALAALRRALRAGARS